MPARSTAHHAGSPLAVAGIGRVLLWKGGSVWVGRDTGQVRPHSHHAIQITLASTCPIRIRSGGEATWHEASAAIVMADRPHQFDGRGHPVAMVFVEPETAAGRALTGRYGDRDVTLLAEGQLDAQAATLHALFDAHAPDEVLIVAGQRAVEQLAGARFAEPVVDPRIARVLERIRDQPDADINLAQAAALVHLSPSRFRHLFVAQTGVHFRAYLLWARVGYAVASGIAGGSWTQAAQQAGFADSAHFTRTCRRMFGIAPTMLVREEQVLPH